MASIISVLGIVVGMKLSYSYTPPATRTDILFDHFPEVSGVVIVDMRVSLSSLPFIKPLHVIALEGGEALKTREQKALIEDRLVELHTGASAHLIGIGGGALLDLAGFVASTYCRGIRYTAVPTTLLGMVDASIGGKNGLNVLTAKNRIGTIHQPEQILIDIQLLDTLPQFELQNGCVEMAKHALINPSIAFEEELPKILSRDKKVLPHAIMESIEVKLQVVEESIGNPEARHLLNLGHTIGHAIETLEQFQLSHGQAVAIGLMAEARLFQEDTTRVDRLIQGIGLPLRLSRTYTMQEWEAALLQDKKNEGRTIYCADVGTRKRVAINKDALATVLAWVNNTFGRWT